MLTHTLLTLTVAVALPAPRDLGLPPPPPAAPALADLDALADRVLEGRCSKKLLDTAEHPFVEAQVVCDAFVAFALINRQLDRGGDLPQADQSRLRALVDDALAAAERAPFATEKRVGEWRFPNSVLYRGILALMLAGIHRIDAGDAETAALFDNLAVSLQRGYAERRLLPSFGSAIWPCDNAIAASALVLHGRLRADELSHRTGVAVARHLAKLSARPRGFPTRVDSTDRAVRPTPRGTAMAWTAAFLAISGLPEADHFATTLLHDFCDRRTVGDQHLAACREWPRHVRRGSDGVSGPILHGYGVGASALALAATRGAGRDRWYRSLMDTARAAGVGAITAAPERFPLENAILLWADSMRSW